MMKTNRLIISYRAQTISETEAGRKYYSHSSVKTKMQSLRLGCVGMRGRALVCSRNKIHGPMMVVHVAAPNRSCLRQVQLLYTDAPSLLLGQSVTPDLIQY